MEYMFLEQGKAIQADCDAWMAFDVFAIEKKLLESRLLLMDFASFFVGLACFVQRHLIESNFIRISVLYAIIYPMAFITF